MQYTIIQHCLVHDAENKATKLYLENGRHQDSEILQMVLLVYYDLEPTLGVGGKTVS